MANLFTALLQRGSWPALMAPAGFAAAGVVGAGLLGLRGYEILAAVALTYCAWLVRYDVLRGAYLLAAQTLTVVLAGLVSFDLGDGLDPMYSVLALSIGLLHVLRTLLGRRIDPLGLAETARWCGLAASGLVPVAYTLHLGQDRNGETLLFLVGCAAGVAVFSQLAAAAGLRRGQPHRFPVELIAAAAVVALLATAASRGIEDQTGWALVLIWCALIANAATSLLYLDRLEPLALCGFAASAAAGSGILGVHGYELLVLAGIAYAAGLALQRGHPNRGLYLLGVQGLLVLLAVLVAADLGADAHGLFVAGAAALAAQHLIRTGLQRRLREAGYSETSLWLSLGLLVLLPLFYTLHAGPDVRRDAVAVELVLLLVAAVPALAQRRAADGERWAWILYPAALALGALPVVLSGLPRFAEDGLLPQPVLDGETAALVLLALGAAALFGEARQQWKSSTRLPLMVAAGGYTAVLLGVASAAGSGLLLSAGFTLGGALFLVLSYSRKTGGLSLGLPPLLFAAAVCLVSAVAEGPADAGYRYLIPAWATAGLLQLLRAVLRPGRGDGVDGAGLEQDLHSQRRRILGAASALIPALAAVPAMAADGTALAGSLTVIGALALAVPEFPRRWREPAAQAGSLIAALAVQRIAWLVLGGVSGFWSLQYWAAVLAGMAAYEFLRKRDQRGTAVLAVSAVILSASGLSTVIFGGGGKQLWALVAHAGLLAFGLLASRRLFLLPRIVKATALQAN